MPSRPWRPSTEEACSSSGIHLTDIPPLRYQDHLFYEREIRSVTANTRSDGEEFLRVATRMGVVATTTPYPLDRADRALADLAGDRFTGAAVSRCDERRDATPVDARDVDQVAGVGTLESARRRSEQVLGEEPEHPTPGVERSALVIALRPVPHEPVARLRVDHCLRVPARPPRSRRG